MTASYASVRGGVSGKGETPPAPLVRGVVARAPTEVERGRKVFVETHLPEAVPLIKALYAEGLIEGWRAVVDCRLL